MDGQIDLTRHIEWWILHHLGHACHWYHGHLFETARKAYAPGGNGPLERLWQIFDHYPGNCRIVAHAARAAH